MAIRFWPMDAIDGNPGEREHGADHPAMALKSLVRDSVMRFEDDQDPLKVVQTDPASMDLQISLGGAVIQGRIVEVHTAPAIVTVPTAHPTENRWDLVVARFNNDPAVRVMEFDVVEGVAGPSPTPPEPTRSGDVWELALAQILVWDGLTAIDDSFITDVRKTFYFRGGHGGRITYHEGGGPYSFDKADYPGLERIRVRLQGAGGGGAGATAGVGAAGGGGGGFVDDWFDIVDLPASEPIVVGAGGSGGAAGDNAGADGGLSSFFTLAAYGGKGGGNRTGRKGGDGGLASSSGPSGISILGQGGGHEDAASGRVMGFGGSSHMGGGAAGPRAGGTSSAGLNGGRYGGGGSGGWGGSSDSAPGGDGAEGLVVIDLYY